MKIYKYTEIKQRTLKQQMHQMKTKTQHTKLIRCTKKQCLQENLFLYTPTLKRTYQINNPILYNKEVEKKISQTQRQYKEGNNKDQSEGK